MDLTMEEFQRLADDKMQERMRNAEQERRLAELTTENEALRGMVETLKRENVAARLENMVLRNYITLSVEKIRTFVSHLRGIERFAFLKTFLEYVLPKERYQEQLLLVNEVMTIPEEPKPVAGETHNHFEAGSGCQVFNGSVTGEFDQKN